MISLFLMNKKGFEVLKAIIENFKANFIDNLICARDPNVINDYYNDIVNLCEDYNINFYERTQSYNLNSKYYFAIGWKWLIHVRMERLIILHDSLLPRYRGFAPLVSCLINKEKKIGVTALLAEKEYDKGDIIEQLSIKIEYPIKIQEAIDKIIPLYKELAINICKKLKSNQDLSPYPQDESKATYSLWKEENDYWIDWSKSANFISRFVDAVGYPYKGSASTIDGKKVRILDVEELEDVKIEIRDVGKVIFKENDYPIVVCGEGLLKIKEIIYDDTKKNVLPLKRFRIRFGA